MIEAQTAPPPIYGPNHWHTVSDGLHNTLILLQHQFWFDDDTDHNPTQLYKYKRTISSKRIGRVEGLLNMRRSVSKGDPIAIAFSGYLLFYIIHDNDKWQMANGKWQEPAANSSEFLTKTSGPERRAAVRVPVSILAFWALVNTDVGGQYWARWSILRSVVNTEVFGQFDWSSPRSSG